MTRDPKNEALYRLGGHRGESSCGLSAAAISSVIVRILRAHAGRGPTKVKTVISADLAVVTLRDCLTKAEKTLADNGNAGLVIQARAALHNGIRADATAAVEEITGRHVTAYFAEQQHAPDIAVIVFLFAPFQGDTAE